MATAQVYVINDGSGTPRVVRRSHATITVTQLQPGEYVVTFPEALRDLTCVATLNNSVGIITAIPGEHSGLLPHQVRVLTSTLTNELAGTYDFSLAVFVARPAEPLRTTFYVEGRHLYDLCGEQVILRGVNKMAVWNDADPICATVFPEIKQTGANVVRIVWLTDGSGNANATLSNMDAVIQQCRDNQIIPMIELHDATGDWSRLGTLVEFWTRPEVVNVVQKHAAYLLVNIGNEVGDDQVTDADFQMGYSAAITAMRQAGITVPLVIDAACWGQGMSYILNNAAALLAQDPNLIFSLHVWWHYHVNAAAEFVQAIDDVVVANIPFIVGEFSGVCQECDNNNNDSPYIEILTKCQQAAIGWIAWEWGPGNEYGSPPCPAMNMTVNGHYATLQAGWARSVAVDHPYSIKNTAVTPYFLTHGRCAGEV
jgi:mannan endo-1,4-beta-mannosidase